MLASRNRLKKKINFARIEIDGRMFQSKSFGMGVYDRKDGNDSRFGFIISTKISKKAVARNKIKRIIADTIRKRINNLKIGHDVLFLIKPSIVNIDTKTLENEVNAIITKNL